jgi:hypothetical protein
MGANWRKQARAARRYVAASAAIDVAASVSPTHDRSAGENDRRA